MRLGGDKKIKQVAGKGEGRILLEKGELRVNRVNHHSDEQEVSAGSSLEMRTRAPSLGTGSAAFYFFACSRVPIYLKLTEFPLNGWSG